MLLCYKDQLKEKSDERINSWVKHNVVNVFNKLDKYNITGKTHYNLWQGNIQYDREKGTKGQLILVRQQELNMIIRQYLSISWSNSENKVLLQN